MGDTGTVVGIIAAILALGALVWLVFLRGKGADQAFPSEQSEPEPRPRTPGAEPEAKKAEPEAKKAEHEAKRAEPEAKEAEPEAKRAEPEAKEAEPEAKRAEPEAKKAEPEAKKAEPEAKKAEPEAKKAEPEAKKAEPQKLASDEDLRALKRGLATTRGGFIARLAKVFGRKRQIDPQLLEEIQEVLIMADIGVKTSEKILERLRQRMENNELTDEDRVWDALRAEARSILSHRDGGLDIAKKPSLILVVGVNGVGKTTTIGKLASRYKSEGREVVLAAGDTFRAAAVLQLEVWGRRVGCEVVKGKERADPASVIFEAVKRAREGRADLVIADTAGRLHTKSNLMEELKKVVRTAEKALERPVDEILLVLDSTTGQNAIQQAQLFKEAIPVSGVALTKLDGTARGGVILGIADEHQLPVHFVGIGERVEDLREFDGESFVEALFEKPDEDSAAA